MKWTDEQLEPVDRVRRSSVQHLIDELATQPGRWAEVARYPEERKASAYSRGSTTAKRHPALQYAVQRAPDGGGVVLYYRVPA